MIKITASGQKNTAQFLHVGCGFKRKNQTTIGFNTEQWDEIRLDLDPKVMPDIVGSMVNMHNLKDQSVDAIFSSHNIEHLYPHEIPIAMAEFKRVLKVDGYVVLTCPDLQSVCAAIVEDKLTDPLYTSPAGPIAPVDIVFGYRAAIAAGNTFMAHRSGFTQKVLVGQFQAAGFSSIAALRRHHPFYDIWVLASLAKLPEDQIKELVALHLPVQKP
jgi:ubiquinone/menaquinone biosynthesis C-methylase UbiE